MRLLTACVHLAIDDASASVSAVQLEFLVSAPPRASWLRRSAPKTKVKSTPLLRSESWCCPPMELPLMPYDAKVRCRLRVPTPHGKDRKSAAVDVWVIPQQQQQQLQLTCRIGDSVVEAKAMLTLTEAAAAPEAEAERSSSWVMARQDGTAAAAATTSGKGPELSPLMSPSGVPSHVHANSLLSEPYGPQENADGKIAASPMVVDEADRHMVNKRPWWSLAGLFNSFSRGTPPRSPSNTSVLTTDAAAAAALAPEAATVFSPLFQGDPSWPPATTGAAASTSGPPSRCPSAAGAIPDDSHAHPRHHASSYGGSSAGGAGGSLSRFSNDPAAAAAALMAPSSASGGPGGPRGGGGGGGSNTVSCSGASLAGSEEDGSPLHKRPRVVPLGLAGLRSLGRPVSFKSSTSVAPLPPRPPAAAKAQSHGLPLAPATTPATAIATASSPAASPVPPALTAAADATVDAPLAPPRTSSEAPPPRPLSTAAAAVSSFLRHLVPNISLLKKGPQKGGTHVPPPLSEQLRADLSAAIAAIDLQLLQVCAGSPPSCCPRLMGYKATLEHLLLQPAPPSSSSPHPEGSSRGGGGGGGGSSSEGAAVMGGPVEEAVARALLDSILMEVTHFDKGEALGGGWHFLQLPLRRIDGPLPSEPGCAGPAEAAATAAAGPGCAGPGVAAAAAADEPRRSGDMVLGADADVSAGPRPMSGAGAGTSAAHPRSVSAGFSTLSSSQCETRCPGGLGRDSMEVADPGTGVGGGEGREGEERGRDGMDIVAESPSEALADEQRQLQTNERPGSDGAHAPRLPQQQGDVVVADATPPQQQRYMSVRALYAPVDQVAAGGERACTSVALEVAAWLEAGTSGYLAAASSPSGGGAGRRPASSSGGGAAGTGASSPRPPVPHVRLCSSGGGAAGTGASLSSSSLPPRPPSHGMLPASSAPDSNRTAAAAVRELTPEALSELVLRGCSIWRAAQLQLQEDEAAAAAGGGGGCGSVGEDGMLGFHAALELRNLRCGGGEGAGCDGRVSWSSGGSGIGRHRLSGGGSCRSGRSGSSGGHLWEVLAAYSQVGHAATGGNRNDDVSATTTFPAFVAATAAAAAASGSDAPLLLVAAGHCTLALFRADGRRVLFVNSLGRSLGPNCRCAHALEFASLPDFCAYYCDAVRPAGWQPTQVEAHRVSRNPLAVGLEPELQLYMPPHVECEL